MSVAMETEAFAPRGRSSTALLFQARPERNPRYRVYGGPPGAPSVFIHRRALDQISEGSLAAFPSETIGVLLGRPCRDERGVYAIVEVGLAAGVKEHEGTGGMVRISAQGRSTLHRRAGQLHPALEPIGWWHSHPHGPARYSSVDLDEQATFPRPYHVGIVVAVRSRGEDRGRDGPFGVYVGPGGLRLWSQRPPDEPDDTRPRSACDGEAPHGELPDHDSQSRRFEGARQAPKADPRLALLACAVALAVAVALWIGLATQGGSSTSVSHGEGVGGGAPSLEGPGALEFPAPPRGIEDR